MTTTSPAELTTTAAAPATSDVNYLTYVGGRKFLLAVLVIFLTALLCWFGKISDAVYSYVAITVIGSYLAGNVVQTIKTTGTSTPG